MIRLLFDECGDAHRDIMLKIDAMPVFCKIADTYFLGDFLPETQRNTTEVVLNYLKYFKDKVDSLTDQESFVIFDISDQYIGGLFMSKGKNEMINTRYARTDKLEGHSISRDTIEHQVREKSTEFQIEREWQLPADRILQGLDWSTQKITRTAYNSG